jgi:hypothetical protein
MFKNLMKKIKSNRGNSLAEFAVVTAMMATMATTADPKHRLLILIKSSLLLITFITLLCLKKVVEDFQVKISMM